MTLIKVVKNGKRFLEDNSERSREILLSKVLLSMMYLRLKWFVYYEELQKFAMVAPAQSIFANPVIPPCLYVKAAVNTYQMGLIFTLARAEAPCVLILEDIEIIVTAST